MISATLAGYNQLANFSKQLVKLAKYWLEGKRRRVVWREHALALMSHVENDETESSILKMLSYSNCAQTHVLPTLFVNLNDEREALDRASA